MILENAGAAAELLRSKGLSVTHQRLAILAALRGSRSHPSADELYARLKPRHPALSRATVYKTLEALRGAGLASIVNAPHAEARYDGVTGTHHHAICTACGRIEDLFDARLDALAAAALPRGFCVTEHSVHFRGVCAACRKPTRR